MLKNKQYHAQFLGNSILALFQLAIKILNTVSVDIFLLVS